jgi:glycosyltransferase involved in cell wall biosynthesis
MTMRAVAIVCARNEEAHLRYTLADLIGEGLDAILIDHDSTDGTVPVARTFVGRGLLAIERLPWTGRFSLAEQLEAKWRIIEQLDHDWIVHVDADEWLSGPETGQTLLAGLQAADAAGFNSVHFNEFVFLPRRGEDVSGVDYRRRMTRYYFHQPRYPFLLRAWKNRAGLDNREQAGHLLSSHARWFPRDFPLRHYILLSEARGENKYLTRKFDEAEIARGWHGNRVRATKENLRFPPDDRMLLLPDWTSKDFDASHPLKEHFWEWTRSD